jgi:hypothetical protein
MEELIPEHIIVPVYYFIDEDGKVHFDIDEMSDYFANEIDKLEKINN